MFLKISAGCSSAIRASKRKLTVHPFCVGLRGLLAIKILHPRCAFFCCLCISCAVSVGG